MLTIIFSWLVFGVAIYLVGRLVLSEKILKFLRITETVEWYEYFWIGLVAVIGILQVWSLFLPVNTLALAFIMLLSAISLLVTRKKGFSFPPVNIGFVVISGLLLFLLSYFSSLSVGWPDTYGYHLIAVRWANLYKVVPGLANLYTRLGFNSSFFLFASMIDNLFLKDRSSHVALSLLASTLSLEFFWILIKSKNNYLKGFILLAVPIFIEGIVHDVQISSLSYDFVVLITVLAICIELIGGNRKSIFIAAALSLMLVTIKLSGAVFAMFAICYCAYKLFKEGKGRLWAIIYLGLIVIALPVTYIVRNLILSGWPLYPLPILGVNFPWTVPQRRVAIEAEVIKAWAIFPGNKWGTVVGLSFFQWLPGWLSRNAGRMELKIFFLAILFFFVSVAQGIFNKKIISKNIGLIVCGIASFASMLYMMVAAPDLRFGAIYFWVFFASFGSLFFIGVFKNLNFVRILVPISILLTIFIAWPPRLDSKIMLKSLRWDQPGDIYRVLITPSDGSPSFEVYTPKDNSSCGDTQLPCTSEVSNNFREIIPGKLSGGFTPVR